MNMLRGFPRLQKKNLSGWENPPFQPAGKLIRAKFSYSGVFPPEKEIILKSAFFRQI